MSMGGFRGSEGKRHKEVNIANSKEIKGIT